MLVYESYPFLDIQKKEGLSPDNPIFINLKSNTMKNTMQKYNKKYNYANILLKNMFYSIKCANFDILICQNGTNCQLSTINFQLSTHGGTVRLEEWSWRGRVAPQTEDGSFGD